MKKIIFLLLLVNSISNAQNKNAILDSDISFKKNDVYYEGKDIYFLNADKKEMPVSINILCTVEQYRSSNINAEKLNKMIVSSYYNAFYAAKNKYTFTAREIYVFFYEKHNLWSISTSFTAQNDYGALKDTEVKTFFDFNGDKEVDLMDYIDGQKKTKENPGTKQSLGNKKQPEIYED